MNEYRLIKEYPGSPALGTIKSLDWFNSTKYLPEIYQPYWEKISKLMLTTEDGVDKYEMDDYYFVWFNVRTERDTFPRTWLGTNCSCRLVESSFKKNENHKYFHSKSKAEQFVIDNTPVITVEEAMKIGVDIKLIEELRKIAKQKINDCK